MSTPKCEMCGQDIPNAKNRQKFCPDCVKKRQAVQSRKSYLKYSITQVVEKAKDLGISYGWCSYLLSVGKVCME